MITMDQFANQGLDRFDETILARPYREIPGVLGDDGK